MIVVTGGAGKAGRAVVRDLLEHGEEVLSVDRLTVIDQVGDELLAPDLCRAHEVDAQHLLSVLE